MGGHANIEGPIVGGAHGWAFGAAGDELAPGYVEEEYFADGVATHYAETDQPPRPAHGRWAVEATDTSPFTTRFIVRRPARQEDFNGTVVVCWNNVSAGLDMVGPENSELAEGGFAFVGVTPQRIGIEGHPWAPQLGLKGWDPERYGSLSIPSDLFSGDIFSQVGRLVGRDRPRSPIDPMGGLEVGNVIAYGASQSAQVLGLYVNTLQALDHVYDGFILDVFFGASINVADAGETVLFTDPSDFVTALAAMRGGPAILRTDVGVPILVITTESEAPMYYPARQPDSDIFRLWEVAGGSHAGGTGMGMPASLAHDLGMPELPIELGDTDPPSAISIEPVRSAAFHQMHHWVADGTVPPAFPRLEMGDGDPPVVFRDEHDNGIGGIRLPDMAVPTATNKGDAIDGTRSLTGSHQPFSPETLRELYPDHETYVALVERSAKEGVAAGYLLPRHADEYVHAAQDAPIP